VRIDGNLWGWLQRGNQRAKTAVEERILSACRDDSRSSRKWGSHCANMINPFYPGLLGAEPNCYRPRLLPQRVRAQESKRNKRSKAREGEKGNMLGASGIEAPSIFEVAHGTAPNKRRFNPARLTQLALRPPSLRRPSGPFAHQTHTYIPGYILASCSKRVSFTLGRELASNSQCEPK
jgi:hypothetical protein